MAGEWRESTIGGLCDAGVVELQTGPFGSQLHAYDYVADGVPVVPTEAIRGRRIDHSVLPKISLAKAQDLARHRLQPGDILFARRGVQATGHIGCIREAEDGFICGTGAIRLRVNRKMSEVNADFLSHVLADPASVEWFKFHAIGATMPNLNEGIIRSFPLDIPPLPEQRAIAHILGTLDDKIELNRRMNEILEAIARALFKSWFVEFDPVRAKAGGRDLGVPKSLTDLFPNRFEDSELGEIPEGWIVSPLSDVCERITDGSHSSPKSIEVGRPMASVKDMRDWGFDLKGCRRISEKDYEELVRNDCRPLKQDVLIAKDGSYLKHIFVVERDLDLVILSSIAILRPNKQMDPHLLAFSLRSDGSMARMEQYVSGAVLQRIVLKDFRKFPILVPPKDIQQAWAQFAGPLVRRCWRNVDESETLATLRDTLLPKLISGEVRAKQWERSKEIAL